MIETSESGDSLLTHFVHTLLSLKKGDDKKLAAAVPPLDSIENRLKLQPKSLVVEGSSFDIRLLANNQLERVSFSRCKLLPKGIWKLEFLRELHLTSCQLDQLPDRLSRVSGTLTVLNLSNNNISHLDPRLVLWFKSLKHLNLSGNAIRVLPFELVFLKNLLHLDLSRNQIKRIPFTIGLMKSLKQLNLSHNRLDHFPESIIRPLTHSARLLLRLDSLDLSGNRLAPPHPIPPPDLLLPSADQRDGYRAGLASPDLQVLEGRPVLVTPPTLFEISARAVMKCSRVYLSLHSWLPRTVYEFLQENAAACSGCTSPCVAFHSERLPSPGHFSLLANTIQTDAATARIPILRFTCWRCDLKRRVNPL